MAYFVLLLGTAFSLAGLVALDAVRQVTVVDSLSPDVVDHIRRHDRCMFATHESETHRSIVQLELTIGNHDHAVSNHTGSFTVEDDFSVIHRLGFGLTGEEAFQRAKQGRLSWHTDSIWKSLHGIAP